jgi:hypothetical protein
MYLSSKCASLLLIVSLALGVAGAQVSTGTIVGVVQDNAGGVLHGAAVNLIRLPNLMSQPPATLREQTG